MSPSSRPRVRARIASGLAVMMSAALLAGSVPAQAQPVAGSDGIGDAYFPRDGNGGIDVRRYKISDRYRFATGRLSGRTVVTGTTTADLSSFNLDFLLPVTRVRLNGSSVDFSRPSRHELRIEPRRALPEGSRFTATVHYAGHPDRLGYLGERNWLANRHEVVAMNQPHMAPWWFPSNDHPSDKALMDISITVRRGKQVFANGALVDRDRRKGLVTHRWRADEPMSTYLAMFAAGDFQVDSGVRDGLPWRAVVSRLLTRDERQDNMALMRQTPRVVAGLEEDLGDYPFTRVGGLVTGLDVGFALENQTLPTYPVTGRGSTWLVVHELAHQWFGDSVGLRRWKDIWLNEGAASFMEVRWEETHGGQAAASWLRRVYGNRAAEDSFWDLTIGDPGAARIFAGPVYTRGAMTFQALRNRIGEDDFWTLLQRWVSENRNGLGTRREFRRLAEDVSGEQLGQFFRVWLDLGRKPADIAPNGLG
ncbi:MAG: M1 family metallopeptidase [Nocardioides sp.]